MLDLLRALWQSAPDDGYLTIWEMPGKTSIHCPIRDILSATQEEIDGLKAQLESHNVYFGLGLRQEDLGPHTRGKKEDVTYLPGWAIDIDIRQEGAHQADNLPETYDDVDKIMEGAPPPTAIVHTGNGLHCYFAFSTPLKLSCPEDRLAADKAFKLFQQPVIDRAASLGWLVDKTSTIDRVWRLPGFRNRKREPYPMVEVLQCDPTQRNAKHPWDKYSKPSATTRASSLANRPAKVANKNKELPDNLIPRLKTLKNIGLRKKFLKILAGKSFAGPGTRDTAMQQVCCALAWVDEAQTEPRVLAEILRGTFEKWAADKNAILTADQEIDKAVDKISRAQDSYTEHHEDDIRRKEALKEAETKHNIIKRHFALQRDTVYYVYNFREKRYWPPHTWRELPTILRDAWDEYAPVEKTRVDEKGDIRVKTIPELLDEYSTVVQHTVNSLIVTEPEFDSTSRTIRIPVGARRELSAKRHPEIEEWLHLIPHKPDHVNMLLDWLSTLTCLNKMSAALYLSGPKGTGKSMLVGGAARLWRSGPTKLQNVFTRFNSSMMACPLINADEAWHNQDVNICARLRELVGNMTHQIEAKGRNVETLEGAVRLIITANNETLLNTRGNGDQNSYERDATVERILHIPTSSKASIYLHKSKNKHDWIEKNMLAEHLLWLRDERAEEVIRKAEENGYRFLVQGDESDSQFYDAIGSREKDYDAAVRWLSCILVTPPTHKIKDKVSVKKEKVIVVPRAMCDSWKSYGLAEVFDTPTSSVQATRMLRPFILHRSSLNGQHAYTIDMQALARAVVDEGLVTPGQMREKFGIEIK